MDLKDKTILITGGSGSFGTAMTKTLLKTNIKEIILFSRSEKNQWELTNELKDKRIKMIIGDIRDYEAINTALNGVDICLHAGAMKHIDKCQTNPFECVKTNIIGSMNVIQACINNKVKKLVCLSTDKATNATTLYGNSKMTMEFMAQYADNKDTDIILTRYGNVVGSNGSVVPLFKQLAKEGKPLTITNPDMTRFFMSMEEAIELVLFALENGKNDDLFVYNNKACSIKELADCISNNQIINGVRCIEKTDEALLTINELNHSEKIGNYFRVNKELASNLYSEPLTSDNCERFTIEEVKALIDEC